MFRWHVITGEYPPQPGGVSDYTRLVARELVKAGDKVDVWSSDCSMPQTEDVGLRIHRLPGHFGPRALAAMGRSIAVSNGARILVQYVPHAFGFRAMNLLFCGWLYARRRRDITVMFHEVAYPLRASQPPSHNVLAAVNRVMAAMAVRSATRVFVSSSSWERLLRPLVAGDRLIECLPVPSSIPPVDDCEGRRRIRSRYQPDGGLVIGHFGTYGSAIRGYLDCALPQLLGKHNVNALLLGRGSVEFCNALIGHHPTLAGRLHASGGLPGKELSLHLSACDLMIQPYPDGISTRRTSAMAALSHGRPIVTTSGRLTEPLWSASKAVVMSRENDPCALVENVAALLDDTRETERLGRCARTLYLDRFDVRHTINRLRAV